MKRSVKYPDWVEKYRGKGRTIRKVRNGYGLYECTSIYVPGMKYPKSKQKYLGMITEKDGFIPKKTVVAPTGYLEYGLSHFIMANYKRDLMRSVFQSSEELIIFGIIYHIFDGIDEIFIRSTYLSHGRLKELIDRAAKGVSINRMKAVSNKINGLLEQDIPNDKDRNILIKLLMITVIGIDAQPESVIYTNQIKEIAERYGMKL